MLNDSYQHPLKLCDRLVSHGGAVDLLDLITYVQRSLPVYHAAMHNACYDATTVVR